MNVLDIVNRVSSSILIFGSGALIIFWKYTYIVEVNKKWELPKETVIEKYSQSILFLFFPPTIVNKKIKNYLEKYYLKHAYKVPDEFREFVHQ